MDLTEKLVREKVVAETARQMNLTVEDLTPHVDDKALAQTMNIILADCILYGRVSTDRQDMQRQEACSPITACAINSSPSSPCSMRTPAAASRFNSGLSRYHSPDLALTPQMFR